MININEFPKSKKLLGEFGKRNLSAFQKNIMKEREIEGVEIPEITDEMADSYANALLTTQPRILFSFFDENKLYIDITYDDLGVFYKQVYTGELDKIMYQNREEAEIAGFLEAFKLLEEKL